MMLPTNPETNKHLPVLVGILGANQQIFEYISELTKPPIFSLNLTPELVESDTQLTCDAVIGIIDGNLGISPELIVTWAIAVENDLPRLLLATNTVTGRADFDEALALCELVLDEDIAMRYYPIEEESEAKYVGLLDVLTHEVLQPNKSPVRADPEHISLTTADHDDLVDFLAHADLTDGVFESHAAGLPVSLPRLQQIWQEADLVTVMPIDNEVSSLQLITWLNNRKVRWIPTVEFNTGIANVVDLNCPIGIGIGAGIARVWNSDSETKLEIYTKDDEIISLPSMVSGQVILHDKRIHFGDTLRPANSNYLISAPRI